MSEKWSDEEVWKLEKVFPLVKNDELITYFPSRTLNSIMKKAYKLGLKKGDSHVSQVRRIGRKGSEDSWTLEEIELLKKYYPIGGPKTVQRYINRTLKAIKVKAQVMGVKIENRKDKWIRQEEIIQEDVAVRMVKVVYERERV